MTNLLSDGTKGKDYGALLLCGGKGSRLTEITEDKMPKSLTQVAGRTLLQHSVDLLSPELISTIYLLVGHHYDQVQEWADKNIHDHEVQIVHQTEPGIRGALIAGAAALKESAAVVMNTDELRLKFDLNSFIDDYTRKGRNALMLGSHERKLFRHRLLQVNEDDVLVGSELKSMRFRDDDNTIGLVNAGVVMASRDLFSHIDESFGNDWSSFIDPLMNLGVLAVHKQQGVRYFNVGTLDEYTEATDYYNPVQTT